MPSSRVEQQVQWAAANDKTLTVSNQRYLSDAVYFDAEDWDADLFVRATNLGAPASGDVVDVYIHYTCGDVDADTFDDFATNENAEFLFRLDTVAANTPGENPTARVMAIRTTAKGFKLGVQGAQVSSRNIKVEARVASHRPQ